MNTSVKKSKKSALGRGYASLLGNDKEQEAEVKQETVISKEVVQVPDLNKVCLLYTSPSPRDQRGSRMPSSA